MYMRVLGRHHSTIASAMAELRRRKHEAQEFTQTVEDIENEMQLLSLQTIGEAISRTRVDDVENEMQRLSLQTIDEAFSQPRIDDVESEMQRLSLQTTGEQTSRTTSERRDKHRSLKSSSIGSNAISNRRRAITRQMQFTAYSDPDLQNEYEETTAVNKTMEAKSEATIDTTDTVEPYPCYPLSLLYCDWLICVVERSYHEMRSVLVVEVRFLWVRVVMQVVYGDGYWHDCQVLVG
eukprot:g1500.t1